MLGSDLKTVRSPTLDTKSQRLEHVFRRALATAQNRSRRISGVNMRYRCLLVAAAVAVIAAAVVIQPAAHQVLAGDSAALEELRRLRETPA